LDRERRGIDVKDYITATLEEYKTLRDESRQCSINMFSVFSIGLGAIGIIAAVGFNLLKGETVVIALLIFYLFIPILSIAIAFLWIGEAARFKRAGDYICFIEVKLSLLLKRTNNKEIISFSNNWSSYQEKIEEKLKFEQHVPIDLSDPLAWERWLRGVPLREDFSLKKFPPISLKNFFPDIKGWFAHLEKQFILTGHLGWVYKLRLGTFLSLSILGWLIACIFTFYYGQWLFILLAIITAIFYYIAWRIIYGIGKKIAVKTEPITVNDLAEKTTPKNNRSGF